MPSSNPLIQVTYESISSSKILLKIFICFSAPLPSPCGAISSHPACNCDPMGSVSMQCHNNGTCRCRQGFVGYKCDKCELNYFHNRATHQCEECPVCYGLVKKQVSWFKIVYVLIMAFRTQESEMLPNATLIQWLYVTDGCTYFDFFFPVLMHSV